MKFTITGLKKITHVIEGRTPSEAISRFVGATGGAEPTILNGREIIGQCERCHTWILDGEGEFYDAEQLICGRCYYEVVREQGYAATDEPPDDVPTDEELDAADHDEWDGSEFADEEEDI